MNKAKSIIASYVGTMLFASFLFISAWSLYYWQGILFLLISIIGTTLNHILLPKQSSLQEDRINKTEKGVSWDKNILKLYFLISLLTFIVAGLDSGRFHWTKNVSIIITIVGSCTTLIGQLIFAFAKRQNTFFSSTVQIQDDKKHTVCKSGLYKIVRHPGYLGMIISMMSFPLVIGSIYASIPAFLCIILLIVRTGLEDSFLQKNLEDYIEYSKQVKWKLLPFIY